MSALPASPRIAAGEKIYRKIITLCARYNSGEDPGIVMRGWDADLKTLITQKLSRLGICVLVCAPKRKPLQEQGGTNAVILTTKIVIESNPLLKKSDATAVLGWDADDLADLLAIGLDGHREPGWLTCMTPRPRRPLLLRRPASSNAGWPSTSWNSLTASPRGEKSSTSRKTCTKSTPTPGK